MTAVEIMRAFHGLDDGGRAEVIRSLPSPPDRPRTLANEIAELPDAERDGVLAAIKQDFEVDGTLKGKGAPKPEPEKKAEEETTSDTPAPEAEEK